MTYWPRSAALALVFGGGILARAWPLLWGNGFRVGASLYDDGVYVSSALLFAQGLWPYRDYVLVHPPGLTLLLQAVAPFSPAGAYLASRWLFVGVGVVNLSLTAWAARRWLGPWPAVAAVAVYAFYPEIVVYERGAFLEPILNTGALLLLCIASGRQTRLAMALMGLVLGSMCCVKVTGTVWAVPVAYWAWRAGKWPAMGIVAISAGLAIALVVLPFAMKAPLAFVQQTVEFHLDRPFDGVTALRRLQALWQGGWHVVVFCALVAATATWRGRPLEPQERSLLTSLSLAAGVLLTLFLTAKTFWVEYTAVLAPLFAMAVALSVAAALGISTGRRWHAAVVSVALAVGVVRLGTVQAQARDHTDDIERSAEYLRRHAANASCITTMEPSWLLAADRVPGGSAPVIDSYATLLSAAPSLATETQRFGSVAASERMQSLVAQCDFIIWGWRGDMQSSEATRRWLAEQYQHVFPPTGEPGISIFRRR